jgi:hypothetical protein
MIWKLFGTTDKNDRFKQEQEKAQQERRKMIQITRRIAAAKIWMKDIERDIDSFTDGAIVANRAAKSDELKLLDFEKRLENCSPEKRDFWKGIIHLIRSSKIGNENHRDKCLEIVDELKYKQLELETKLDRLEYDLGKYQPEEADQQFTEYRKGSGMIYFS